MKVISPLFSSMSGKLGGAVGSKARGGINYFRALVIPTNPSTLLQTAIRQAVQSVSSLWQNVLTETQQQGWWDIATGSSTGKTLFSKVNQPRIYATNTDRVTTNAGVGTTIVPAYLTDAPSGGLAVDFALDNAPVIDDPSNELQLGTIPAGNWNAGADGTHKALVFVYVSGPQDPSRFARQHPYQLVRCLAIAVATAPAITDIDLSTYGIPTVEGKVCYVKVYAQDKEGRTSLPIEYRVTITA